MNDRIKELAEQATASISYRVCQNTFKEIDDSAGPFVREEFSKEKFAELIVRECANKAYHTAFDDLTHSETESQIPGHIYREVLEHFGIE